MTQFWLATKSTTAALCLLGIGANTALGMEALIPESDLNDLDECETFDTLALDSLFSDADSLNCDASMLEDAETFEGNDSVEFEEFADPSWQEENAAWETAEPLPAETEAEWDNIPDAATENWDAPELTETMETEGEIVSDTSSEWDSPPGTETVEAEWETVPDAATENWDSPATMAESEAEWEAIPDTSLEEWDSPTDTETVETEWDSVPDAAAENWDAPVTAIGKNQIEWDNTPDLSETEEFQPAIATAKQGEHLEDDPQFQAVLEPEEVKEEVAKLAPEDLIRDDRQISELIAPTPEQQHAKTTGLPPEEVMRVAEDNVLPEITTDEATAPTPLLDRLDADLRRLRSQAEIVTSQSLNVPTFVSQPVAFKTYTLDFNNDLSAISSQQLEQWGENPLAGKFNLDDEFALENKIDIEAIANSVNPQLFERDLSELGLEIFNTELLAGEAIATSLFLTDGSFENFSFEMDFNSVLAGWENAIADTDLAALLPEHLLMGSSTSFMEEIPDLSGQGENVFAIESEFEVLPELNFGNHPFEFGFQRDFLRASLSSPSKKSI